jgi:hypothetical protein
MFGLFKRTNVESWEAEMLRALFNLLNEDYEYLKKQIEDGLLKRVLINNSGIINYVGFSFNPHISRKYENNLGRFFVMEGIQIFNLKTNDYTPIQIYISYGLVCGYSTPIAKKFLPDIDRIEIRDFTIKYLDENNESYEKIKVKFTNKELAFINPSDVYEVILKGKKYYHLKNLEDGDFLAIDENINIYEIKHDPFEIIELKDSLINALSN